MEVKDEFLSMGKFKVYKGKQIKLDFRRIYGLGRNKPLTKRFPSNITTLLEGMTKQ
jgi:hypothetical protein